MCVPSAAPAVCSAVPGAVSVRAVSACSVSACAVSACAVSACEGAGDTGHLRVTGSETSRGTGIGSESAAVQRASSGCSSRYASTSASTSVDVLPATTLDSSTPT